MKGNLINKFAKEMFSQISFFLGGSKKVASLEEGAIENGGATHFGSSIISNIETDNFIKISNSKNILRLFVPSTLNVNSTINNIEYVKKYYSWISRRYNNTITVTNTKGSWYSDNTKSVVIEDVTILELHLKEVKKCDINFFLDLGLTIKEEMLQDSVSVMINDALCLV